MVNFIEAIAKTLKTEEFAKRSLEFLNNLITYDDNESEEAIVIRKGNCEIRLSDDKIELIHDRLVSTKLTITKDDVLVKWRDGSSLNLDDAKRVSQFLLRPQLNQPSSGSQVNINPSPPIAYNPATGNLAIALAGVDPITYSVVSGEGRIGIKFDPRSPFQWNPLTGQFNIGIFGTLPITFNSTTGSIGIRFNPIAPLTYDTQNGNLGLNPSFTNLVLSVPTNPVNTSLVPLVINTVSGGANTLEVRRQDNTLGFTIFNSGSIEVALNSFYRHSGSQVLGARRTGWIASTGTANRTAFATSTATTVQVAERLKALIDDLIAHGLIGT